MSLFSIRTSQIVARHIIRPANNNFSTNVLFDGRIGLPKSFFNSTKRRLSSDNQNGSKFVLVQPDPKKRENLLSNLGITSTILGTLYIFNGKMNSHSDEMITVEKRIIEEVRSTAKKINNNLNDAENRINDKIIYSIATLVIIRLVFW